MKAIDVLQGKTIDINESKLNSFEKRSNDYIISIPHSGTLILEDFADNLRVNDMMITDAALFTNDLYDIGKGWRILTKLNRFIVNMNRVQEYADQEILPDTLQEDSLHNFLLDGEPAWTEKYTEEEKQKLYKYYEEYHQYIQQAIEEMKEEKGYVLMFDCHTMNSRGRENVIDKGKERPDFDIGNCGGMSVDNSIFKVFMHALTRNADEDWDVRVNDPFQGGYITKNYGHPRDNIHVIQIEVNKRLYMNEEKFKKKPEQLEKVRRIIKTCMDETAEFIEQSVDDHHMW